MLGNLDGGTALDVCCGSGDFLQIFIDRYGSRVQLVGVDFAARMLELARNRFNPAATPRLLLSRADAMLLPIADSSIDAITIGFLNTTPATSTP